MLSDDVPPAPAASPRIEFVSDSESLDKCVDRLKALADPQRLRIVTALLAGPKNVGQITEELDDEVPRVSHHLGVLRQSGILTATKRGRFVEYALPGDVPAQLDGATGEYSIRVGCCRLILSPGPTDLRGPQPQAT